MNNSTDTGPSKDRLDQELKRHLREIGKEEQPEKLLALARKLQDLLRQQDAEDA